ncbi:hypothetical protein F2Q70_00020786 [Brassica cretica]|uniref:Uncharacterized protein n=1 Tax=Brassica cretica TaxID=69181 RepID=A0A8S9GKW1_BRACR|nr:hypothetical protein F2Q70_00020786 [Brassica cretica]
MFSSNALKEIAGLVDKPICLHPATKNLTNLDVAKVYTITDPRKPLPEAVNASFESGEICITCRSAKHNTEDCPRSNNGPPKDSANKKKAKAKAKDKVPIVVEVPDVPAPFQVEAPAPIIVDAPAQIVVDIPALPTTRGKEFSAALQLGLQKQVFSALKSNRSIAFSSGTRSPPVPLFPGSSQGTRKAPPAALKEGVLLDCLNMASPRGQNFLQKKMITRMTKGTSTSMWSPRGFKNN